MGESVSFLYSSPFDIIKLYKLNKVEDNKYEKNVNRYLLITFMLLIIIELIIFAIIFNLIKRMQVS